MTTQEFSNQFDTLAASYITNVFFDEYEKSVFLTQAQNELTINLYNGKNTAGDSFESSEEIRKYLQPLVTTYIVDKEDFDEGVDTLADSKSYAILLPDDIIGVVYESVDFTKDSAGCLPNKGIQVTPVTHDDFHVVKRNPFRRANDHRVLRLDSDLEYDGSLHVELISKYDIDRYFCRYLRKPRPIVLTDLEDIAIDGVRTPQTSELNEALHETILKYAVQLAIQTRSLQSDTK